MADQTSQSPRPETIERLRYGASLSYAMLAGMQLDVFTPLKDGPMTLEQLAASLDVRPIKLSPLAQALVVAKLLTLDGDGFRNTAEANHFLVKGSPAYMGAIHENLAFRWFRTSHTAESIRTGVPQAKMDYAEGSEDEVERGLRSLQPLAMSAARQLTTRWDFSSCQTLTDIGGGSGGLAIAITEAHPHIKATVIDLPNVTAITQRIVDEAGASDRVKVETADVVNGVLTGSYDIAVMKSLIQVLSPGDAVKALKNAHDLIRPGGTLHIIGSILDNSGLSPFSAIDFNLLAINIFDEGQAYTEQEYADWLAEAGFEGFERVSLSGPADLITVRKPA